MRWVIVAATVALCSSAAQAIDRATYINWLDSEAQSRREAAMEELAKEGPEAFDDVSAMLKRGGPRARRLTMNLLAGYAQQMEDIDGHRDVLLPLLGDEDAEVADLAVAILAAAGPKTVPKLFSAAHGKDEAAAARARRALVSSAGRAATYLDLKLASRSRTTLLQALRLLESIGVSCAVTVPRVIELTASKMHDVRTAAYRALASVGAGDPKAMAVLMKSLDDEDNAVASEAGALLGSFAPESTKALIPRLEEAGSLRRDRARYALSNMPKSVKPLLLELLDSKSGETRIDALSFLVPVLEAGEIPERARQLLEKGTPRERIAAARLIALRATSEADLKTHLPALLGDKQKEVGDWAWFRLWWMRRDALPKRELVDPRVILASGEITSATVAAIAKTTKGEAVDEARRAIGALIVAADMYRPGTPDCRAARVAELPKKARDACTLAWTRLASLQSESGMISARHPLHDIGTTALALLAFSAGGHTDGRGPHDATVRRAIRALLARQDKEGLFGDLAPHDAIVQHQMATAALLDAYITGSCPEVEDALGRAIDKMLSLHFRHDWKWGRLAWGYHPVKGQADLYHTIWGGYAMRLGAIANLTGPFPYRSQTVAFVHRLTDPEFGQIGYQVPGGYSSRPQLLLDRFPPEKTQSMTVGAIWLLNLCADEGVDDKLVQLGFRLALDVPPKWDTRDGSIDFTYWHLGSNAFAYACFDPGVDLKVRKARDAWRAALLEALLPNQEGIGSWPLQDPWSSAGGAAYTTATCALALLAPAQFSSDFYPAHRDKRGGAHGEVIEALKSASRSKNPRIAFAAEAALRRLELE